MTYFSFLLRFLVIPILVLFAITLRDNRAAHNFQNARAVGVGIAAHIFLAVIYTTPWDNYLVATGVWHYNPELVSGLVLGFVPVEEYTFFVLETILAGLWWWLLAGRLSEPGEFNPSRQGRLFSFGILCITWIIFTAIFFSGSGHLTYLSITLFWALPAVFPQLIFGADILWHYRKLVTLAVLGPGLYLSSMDIFALNATTWSISPGKISGVKFWGILPLEEVVFFFITSILISFGMTLLLARESVSRLQEIKRMFKRFSA